ncbi:MAG: ATP-grasp fold amidoligase family protein [Paludibacteraceae bacterium]|nr:ATP-grasp fold amidoligase family protein [Paludibacteraceae bacterium]
MYSIQSKVYMGEITFYPASGIGVFSPQEWNYKLGELISLPK